MKINPFNSPTYLIPAFALMSLPVANAQISFDDGAAGDSNWTSADNWDPNGVPGAGNTIAIGDGFTVDYDVGGNLPGSTTLNVDGTLSIVSGGVLRTLGADITVSSTGELTAADTGRFYDMNNATVTFQDGAQFTQGVWENKGTNTFNFELGTTGFDTLTPSRLNVSGGAGNISNATYNADLGGASYIGGSQILTLVDYGTDTHGISNANFQNATLTITDTGTNAARLYWDDAQEAIMLGINQTVTWTGGGGDGLLNRAANWDTPDNKAPIGNDTLLINNGDTVAHANNLPINTTVNLVGSGLTTDGPVIRLNNATINVDSTSALTGGFWDLNNGTLNFQDGAQFTASNWEHKGTNVFDFELSNTGFTALTPGSLRSNSAISTTYRADLASYGGATQDVTLVDFGSDTTGLTNATFTGGGQYTLSIDNTGSNAARLYWDNATDAVKLSINETVTWTGAGGNNFLTTAANWDAPDGKAPDRQ